MAKSDTKDRMRQGGQQIARRGIDHDAARSARLQAGKAELPIQLAVEQLTIDDSIQVRVGGVDPETVESYASIMFEHGGWGPFPPVVAFRDGETLYLSAGFQRCAAAHQANMLLAEEGQNTIDTVPVHIRPGGYAAAVEFAEEDNLQHGKPLSNKDKYNMLERRMERGHPWANMSDRVIARELGVSYKTIGRWRAEITTGTNVPVDSDVRIGADGKVRNVGGIQASNRQRAQQADPPAREDLENLDEREPAGRFVDEPPEQQTALVAAATEEFTTVSELLTELLGLAEQLHGSDPQTVTIMGDEELFALDELLSQAYMRLVGFVDQQGRDVRGVVDYLKAWLGMLHDEQTFRWPEEE